MMKDLGKVGMVLKGAWSSTKQYEKLDNYSWCTLKWTANTITLHYKESANVSYKEITVNS